MAALSLTLLLGAGAIASRQSAEAADSETSALIGLINNYRTSHGISALGTSAGANADAQAAAQNAVNACAYNYGLSGHNAILVSYGYEAADTIFPPWEADSYYLATLSNPYYHSVGIGRARNDSNCDWGYLWIAYFDNVGDGTTTTPTHTPTPSPTPTNTPTPTPTYTGTPTSSSTPTLTPTAAPTPTPTALPSGSDTTAPTSSETVSPTGDVSPTPTPPPSAAPSPSRLQGDANCDNQVNALDSLRILLDIGEPDAGSTCAGADDVNCDGYVDATDAIIILRFVSGDAPSTPQCPAVGSHV